MRSNFLKAPSLVRKTSKSYHNKLFAVVDLDFAQMELGVM
jgi:hypothetical protein